MFEVYQDWYTNHPLILQTPGSLLRRSRKGRTFNIRHMHEGDIYLLTEFLSRLSSSSLGMRFFVAYPSLSNEAISREITRLNQICNSNGAILVATSYVAGQEEIIGLGEMIPDKELSSAAELAVVIRDDYQDEGIGTVMMIQLVQEAAKKGIATLQAEAMVQNRAMLRIWTKLGLPYSFHTRECITTMLARLGW